MKTKYLVGILFISVMLTSSCCEGGSSSDDKYSMIRDTHFVEEHFYIVEKRENYVADGNLREWILVSTNVQGDSIYMGTVSNRATGRHFEIDDELWFNRDVGDKIYFEYIRKERFYRVSMKNAVKHFNEKGYDLKCLGMSQTYQRSYPKTTKKTSYKQVDEEGEEDLSKDRKKLNVEREIMGKERELEKLQDELKKLN